MKTLETKKMRSIGLVLLLGLGFMLSWQSVAEPVDARITLHAAGRGQPWMNISDGRDLPTEYIGVAGLKTALEQDQARPTTLCSADFDEDGVPDLISGYAGPNGGLLVLHRGNLDAIYPNAPEAQQRKGKGEFTDAPFLSPARVFSVPEAPTFLGAGDFDADGHWDVVMANYGSRALYWLPGDGRGHLGPVRRVELPGRVTALVTGEVNRADGLTDVVVGIVGPDGPQVLVFESPNGALRGKPEVFALPAEATALALGQFDEDYSMDLAIAAGRELLIVHGRDRKLSLDQVRQAEVPPAAIEQRSFPFVITALAVGNFTGGPEADLALLSEDGTVHYLQRSKGQGVQAWKLSEARLAASRGAGTTGPGPQLVPAKVSSLPYDDLVVVDPAHHKLHIVMDDGGLALLAPDARLVSLGVEGEPVAVLPMRLNSDALSDLVVLKRGPNGLTVGLTQPTAVYVVNSAGTETRCDIPEPICVTPPRVEGRCVGPCTFRAAIGTANLKPGASRIEFNIPGPGPHRINGGVGIAQRPVTIDGTTQPGFMGLPLIELYGDRGPFGRGLGLSGGNSVVRGLAMNNWNAAIEVIVGSDNNIIEGNFIGTDVTGTVDVRNGVGVDFDFRGSSNNLVGGTPLPARNVMVNDASVIQRGGPSTGNRVQGNFIGTDRTGTVALGGCGIVVNSMNSTIGGTVPGARNVISGNRGGFQCAGEAVFVSGGAGTLVQGNYIGTDVTGTEPLGNGDGRGDAGGAVILSGGDAATVGGTTPAARNLIADTRGNAGVASAGARNSRIQGNYIGTDVTGSVALGNTRDGVAVTGSGSAVGGPGAGNLISSNGQDGVSLQGPTGAVVQGNRIGTDVTGTVAMDNGGNGVYVAFGRDNTIGGTAEGACEGACNLVSANGGDGVRLASSNGNRVQGNFIGTDITGRVALGNALNGVFVGNGSDNTIGGTVAGAGNLISANGERGVRIDGGFLVVRNLVQGNLIGTDIERAATLGNGLDGVSIDGFGATPANTVGGTEDGAGNVIAGNGANGVRNFRGENTIRGNSIFSHPRLGIALRDEGVTETNLPALTSASSSGEGTTIEGTLQSTPNTDFVLEFFANTECNPSGFGEGERFLGSRMVRTDGSGRASFTVTFDIEVPAGQLMTATATNPPGMTWEFSRCIEVVAKGRMK